MTDNKRMSTTRAGLTGLAALVSLLLAACGGTPSPSGVASLNHAETTTTAVGVDARGAQPSFGQLPEELARYAGCMRSHGLADFPDPNVSGTAIKLVVPASMRNSPKFASARAACRKYAPGKIAVPQITAADQGGYLKAAQCMRSHGINGFPDPKFSDGNVTWPIPPSMNTKSMQFLRAREICEMLIKEGLPYSKQAESGK